MILGGVIGTGVALLIHTVLYLGFGIDVGIVGGFLLGAGCASVGCWSMA